MGKRSQSQYPNRRINKRVHFQTLASNVLTNTYKQVSLAILVLMFSVLAGCQSPGEGSPTTGKTVSSSSPSDAEATPAERGGRQPTREVFPARFQATIYEVEAPAGGGGSINAKALEKQAWAAERLLKVLSKAGTAHILYPLRTKPLPHCSRSLTWRFVA